MNFSQYEKLKQKIQQANPEIMEAKRGCYFEWEDENFETTTYYITFVQDIEDVFTGNFSGTIYAQPTNEIPPQIPISWETDDDEFPFFEYAKILGRPIRLADILLALRGVNAENIWGVDISSGEFFGQSMSDYSPTYYKDAHWKLKDDNLDNQSDETKQFLIDLLVS